LGAIQLNDIENLVNDIKLFKNNKKKILKKYK